MKSLLIYVLILLLVVYSARSSAATLEVNLVIENHLFYPSELSIPANKKVKLIIENRDETPEEFDSFDLNREKVIFANSKAVVFIGPLSPGEYHFFGEYNPNTALGKVVVLNKKQRAAEQSKKSIEDKEIINVN